MRARLRWGEPGLLASGGLRTETAVSTDEEGTGEGRERAEAMLCPWDRYVPFLKQPPSLLLSTLFPRPLPPWRLHVALRNQEAFLAGGHCGGRLQRRTRYARPPKVCLCWPRLRGSPVTYVGP